MADREPTDWLDDHEQRAWRGFVSGARRLFEHLDQDLKVHGVTPGDYGILVALSEAPEGRLRMSDLAAGAVESRSRLSHHVGRMEANGLVRRQACPDDRRGSFAVLTAPGRSLMEQVAPHHVAAVRRTFLDQLDDHEVAVIGDAFIRIGEALAADAAPSPATPAPDASCET